MPLDKLLGMLLDIPGLPPVDEAELMRMLDSETARLSEGARIQDFIRVLAVKRVRENLVRASRDAHEGRKHHLGARHESGTHR
jgi:hypothetical protein